MLVRDTMTTGAEAITPDESLQTAATKMRDLGIGALVVCDGGRPVGVLTDRDIVVRGVADGRDPARADVGHAMTRQVFCCSDSDELATAIDVMESHAVRRLPVLDAADQLVGLLSIDDVALQNPLLAGQIIEQSRDPGHHGPSGFWCWWD